MVKSFKNFDKPSPVKTIAQSHKKALEKRDKRTESEQPQKDKRKENRNKYY